jgi:DUF1680 family protein
MGGYLGRKLDLCIRNRIMAQDGAKLVAPFRHRDERQCWQTEFWGKWFTSAAAAYRYKPNENWGTRLPDGVRDLLATQSPDGYIGNYADGSHLKSWDVWGRKYTLLGLLGWFDATQDPAALAGAKRLADHLLSEVGPDHADIVRLGLYRGMPASTVLEPMVDLYRRTGDERYLRFAEYIVARWSSSQGPRLVEKALEGVPAGERFPRPKKWWSWDNGEKAYEMMSCYTGLIDLYRETGHEAHAKAAIQSYQSIRDTEINIAGSGSSDECWYGGKARQDHPAHNMMETCVATSWMQFCGAVLRITGDSRVADEIERTAYNALLGAMLPDGSSFAKYSSLEGVRELGPPQCGMDLNCCTANGPRGLMLLPEIAVMQGADGPVINLYSDGVWQFPKGRIEVTTDYPLLGEINISIDSGDPVRVRIPAWSVETSLNVNGSDVSVRPGTYVVLIAAKTARLKLDMRGRVVRSNDDGYTAIVRGPLVLARDARLGQSIDDPIPQMADGQMELRPAAAPDGMLAAFTAKDLRLCDYASAGNSWDQNSRFRVWMPHS